MTRKQQRTIRELKETNLKLRNKIKKKEFIKEVIKEKVIYKDLKEEPIPEEERYYLEIITNYPNEHGRIVLDSYEKIKRMLKDNTDLFIKVISPSFKPFKNKDKEKKE